MTFRSKQGTYFPIPTVIFGFVLFGLGVYNVFILGSLTRIFIFISIGAILMLTKKTLEFRTDIRAWRNVFDFFGIRLGRYTTIPSELDYANIFPTKLKQVIGTYSQPESNTLHEKEIRINLVHTKRKRIHVFSTKDLALAKKTALSIAKELDLKVYDASQSPAQWIEP